MSPGMGVPLLLGNKMSMLSYSHSTLTLTILLFISLRLLFAVVIGELSLVIILWRPMISPIMRLVMVAIQMLILVITIFSMTKMGCIH